ncbi:MAG TPA: hypothetical protein EYG99_02975 [Candidatus Pacebacteria bacterium]|nr:hypothetical protein [Candidatus Paceibacterota bacterium]
MIERIQNLIEDSTSLDVTKKQVTLFLVMLGALLILVIFMIMRSASSVKEDPKGYIPPKSNVVDPVYVQGQ